MTPIEHWKHIATGLTWEIRQMESLHALGEECPQPITNAICSLAARLAALATKLKSKDEINGD